MALERNALIGAINRRKARKAANPVQQKNEMKNRVESYNSKRNQVWTPENRQATDNMPRVKQRPQVPTDNMPRTQQRQPTPMPQPKPRPATDNMPQVKRRIAPETPMQRKTNMPGQRYNPQQAKSGLAQNELMAKKLQAVRNGLGTRMGG